MVHPAPPPRPSPQNWKKRRARAREQNFLKKSVPAINNLAGMSRKIEIFNVRRISYIQIEKRAGRAYFLTFSPGLPENDLTPTVSHTPLPRPPPSPSRSNATESMFFFTLAKPPPPPLPKYDRIASERKGNPAPPSYLYRSPNSTKDLKNDGTELLGKREWPGHRSSLHTFSNTHTYIHGKH